MSTSITRIINITETITEIAEEIAKGCGSTYLAALACEIDDIADEISDIAELIASPGENGGR